MSKTFIFHLGFLVSEVAPPDAPPDSDQVFDRARRHLDIRVTGEDLEVAVNRLQDRIEEVFRLPTPNACVDYRKHLARLVDFVRDDQCGEPCWCCYDFVRQADHIAAQAGLPANPKPGIEPPPTADSSSQVTPIPMLLWCPVTGCGGMHIDEGEWATRPHKTHLCEYCGWEWRPANVPTVGVGSLPEDLPYVGPV